MSYPPFFTLFNSSLYHIVLPYLEFSQLLSLIRCHRALKKPLLPWMIRCRFWTLYKTSANDTSENLDINLLQHNIHRVKVNHMSHFQENLSWFSHQFLFSNIHSLCINALPRWSETSNFFSYFPNLLYLRVDCWEMIENFILPTSLLHLHIHGFNSTRFFTKNELPCNLKCLVIYTYHLFPEPEYIIKNPFPSSLHYLHLPCWNPQSLILPPFLTHLDIRLFQGECISTSSSQQYSILSGGTLTHNFGDNHLYQSNDDDVKTREYELFHFTSNSLPNDLPKSIHCIFIGNMFLNNVLLDYWMYPHLCHIQSDDFVAQKSKNWKIEISDKTSKMEYLSYPTTQPMIDWTKFECWK